MSIFSYKKGVAALFLFIILFLSLVMSKIMGSNKEGYSSPSPSPSPSPNSLSQIQSQNKNEKPESKPIQQSNPQSLVPMKFATAPFPEDFWTAYDKSKSPGQTQTQTQIQNPVIEKFSCLTDF
jgi:hypothetical protein